MLGQPEKQQAKVTAQRFSIRLPTGAKFYYLDVDKVSHNMGLMCKKLYQHKLMSELQSPVYQQSTESNAEAMSRHKDFNTAYSLDHVDNFPYLYGALKMYKVPPGLRYIAGVRTNRTEQDTDTQPSTFARIHSRPIRLLIFKNKHDQTSTQQNPNLRPYNLRQAPNYKTTRHSHNKIPTYNLITFDKLLITKQPMTILHLFTKVLAYPWVAMQHLN